jgi:hypothetical protein
MSGLLRLSDLGGWFGGSRCRGRLDEGDGVEAEHRPGAAGGKVAQHLPCSSVQKGRAVDLDELLDRGVRPAVGDSNDTDDVNFGSVLRFLVASGDKVKAKGELVALGIALGLGHIDLALELGFGGWVAVGMRVEVDLREEVSFKLQRGRFHV